MAYPQPCQGCILLPSNFLARCSFQPNALTSGYFSLNSAVESHSTGCCLAEVHENEAFTELSVNCAAVGAITQQVKRQGSSGSPGSPFLLFWRTVGQALFAKTPRSTAGFRFRAFPPCASHPDAENAPHEQAVEQCAFWGCLCRYYTVRGRTPTNAAWGSMMLFARI
jgi:hypothetical protein